MTKAFEDTKTALAKAALLTHPRRDAPISTTSDASDEAVGAVLEQFVDGAWVPPARSYDRQNTSTAHLIGSCLPSTSASVISDTSSRVGSSLPSLTTSRSRLVCPKPLNHGRRASSTSSLTYQSLPLIFAIYREKTTQLQTLCQEPRSLIYTFGIDYSEMAVAQRHDSEVQEYRAAASSLKLKDIVIGPNGNTLLCDLSTGQARPIVPTSWRRQVFDLIHNLSHPSVRTTRKLVAAKFVWIGLKK